MVRAVGLNRYGFLERPFFQGVILKRAQDNNHYYSLKILLLFLPPSIHSQLTDLRRFLL